jgi:sugar O-acyltransferase (sialic acid O-acetyltransferase NeuD family)
MEKKSIILIGAGGHCRSVIDVIECIKEFDIKGLIDVTKNVGKKVFGYPIIGSDDQLPGIVKDNMLCLVTIGQDKLPDVRVRLFNHLIGLGANFASIISPLARVSPYASIGKGTIVLHHALVNAGTRIGDNCIINSGSLIEHDCRIEDHVHISTAAVVNGNVKVGKKSFIGSNSVLRQGIQIGENSVIGAGAVVVKSFGNNLTVVGNPAKEKV